MHGMRPCREPQFIMIEGRDMEAPLIIIKTSRLILKFTHPIFQMNLL